MGIDIACSLMVGLPFLEVAEDGGEWWDKHEGELSRYSVWYDCPDKACLLGIGVLEPQDYSYEEVTNVNSLLAQVEKAKEKFKDLTGLEGKVYITPNIT